jgi:hypothetical protein
MTGGERLDRFLDFSAEVTAFTVFELRGTGQADAYLATVAGVVGEGLVDELLVRYERVQTSEDRAARERLLRREIFGDERLGPIARNVIKLWYVGIWYELPAGWREAFGARENDFTFTVSPAAYTVGLLWSAIGANPPGANAPGYGSWAAPPRIPAFGTERAQAPTGGTAR